MAKKKVTTKKIKKKIVKKKSVLVKKTKSIKNSKKSLVQPNPIELIIKENESQLVTPVSYTHLTLPTNREV